jgi:hypothetical protein
MKNAKSVVCSDIVSKIRTLESKKKEVLARLQRAQKQKKEGNRYYRGTELPIEDVIFSIREGQLKSLDISIDFYKKDLRRRSGKS